MNTIQSMTLTGHDTIIFSDKGAIVVVPVVLDLLRTKWHRLLLEIDLNGTQVLDTENRHIDETLNSIGHNDHIILCLCDSVEMEAHLREKGYTPLAEGRGPIALHVRGRSRYVFSGNVRELAAADRTRSATRSYDCWFAGDQIYEITIVTSEEPTDGTLSHWLLSSLLTKLSDGSV
jgi:hypothetical protein